MSNNGHYERANGSSDLSLTSSFAGNEPGKYTHNDLGSIVKPINKPHTTYMEPITRPELDAKLETIETRMDGRIARIEDHISKIHESMIYQRRAIWYAAGTTIAAIIATILAAFTLSFSAFDSGRETAQMAAEARAETAAALSEIRQIVSELKSESSQR